MIGFNSSDTMMAFLRQKRPQGGGLAATVRFTPTVGVAPGTTTLCMGCGQGHPSPLMGAPQDCPADPLNQYMLAPARARAAGAAPAAAATMLYEPYGSETSMRGSLGVADLGPSWTKVALIALGAALIGAGAAVYMTRRA